VASPLLRDLRVKASRQELRRMAVAKVMEPHPPCCSLAALDRHEEALATYRKAIAIAPDLVEARNNLGSSLDALDRAQDAIACYDAVLADHP
jgi:tetratricopeptide (TPR) repeat protein